MAAKAGSAGFLPLGTILAAGAGARAGLAWLAWLAWSLLCLAALLCPLEAGAAAPLVLTEDQPHLDLNAHLERLDDPQGRLTIEQVSSAVMAGGFRPLGDQPLVLRQKSPVVWLRFSLREALPVSPVASRPARGWLLVSDYVYFGRISLHLPEGEGFRAVDTGLYLPHANRDVPNRFFIFRLPEDLSRPATFYLRLEGRANVPAGFAIWQARDFLAFATRDSYLFAMCYGVLAAMILYNAFLAVSLRQRTYAYYVFYIVSVLATLLFLHGQMPALFDFGPGIYSRLFWLCQGLFIVTAYVFIRAFLGTREQAPLWDKVLLGGVAYGVAASAVAMLDQPNLSRALSLVSGFCSPWLAVAAGLAALRRGFKPARYFLVAWGVLALSVFIFALQEVGPLKGSYLARSAMDIGTALESILLSLALAARIRQLRQEKSVLQSQARHYQDLSLTDGLTGLYNRRYFLDKIDDLLDSATEGGHACLIMLDVDDFKSFNDAHGHDQGDLVLLALARVIRECVRSSDSPCRWGGEEFAVLLPDTTLEQAAQVAERVRTSFAKEVFTTQTGARERRTLSLGLAQARPGEDGGQLVRRADQALYAAKRRGKNRLVTA